MGTLAVVDFPDEPTAFDVKAQTEFVTADDTNGDTFPNDGKTGLYVENPTGGQIDLTISGVRRCSHGQLHDAPVPIAAGFDGFVALELANTRFSDSSNVVTLSYSAAGLNVAAVRRT